MEREKIQLGRKLGEFFLQTHGLQKSFYKKAKVMSYENGDVLYSYNLPVAAYLHNDKQFVSLWSGWSQTTAKHIDAFRIGVGLRTIPKSVLYNLPTCIHAQFEDAIYMPKNLCTKMNDDTVSDFAKTESLGEIAIAKQSDSYKLVIQYQANLYFTFCEFKRKAAALSRLDYWQQF